MSRPRRALFKVTRDVCDPRFGHRFDIVFLALLLGDGTLLSSQDICRGGKGKEAVECWFKAPDSNIPVDASGLVRVVDASRILMIRTRK